MSKIINLLKEKGYRRVDTTYYRRFDKEDGNWEYFFQSNEFCYSKKTKISTELFQYRTNNMYLPPSYYDYLNTTPNDYIIIYYQHYVKAYVIFAFYAAGVNGVAEYAIVKDNKCYDYKNVDDWNNLNLPDEYINKFLDAANQNVNILTEQKSTLKHTNTKPVLYNPNLLQKYNEYFQPFAEEVNTILNFNKSNTYANNEYQKITDALKTDNYQLLIENIQETDYFCGKPLLQLAIEYNSKNIFDKLIENKEILNYHDLIYKGCAINYAVINESENRMYYIKKLADLGCNINNRDVFGRNILYDAIDMHNDEVFDYIYSLEELEIDSLPRETKLFDLESDRESGDEMSLLPALHYACFKGYYHAVINITPKVDINASSDDVGTCLFYTILVRDKTDEYYKIIEYLLENGADANWSREREWPRVGTRSIEEILKNSTDERLLAIFNKHKKEQTNE